MVWPPASVASNPAQGAEKRAVPGFLNYRYPSTSSGVQFQGNSIAVSVPGSGVGRLDVGGSFPSGSPTPADALSKSSNSVGSNWYAASGSVHKSMPGPPTSSQGPLAQTMFFPASQSASSMKPTPSQIPGVSLSPPGSQGAKPGVAAPSTMQFKSPLATAPSTSMAPTHLTSMHVPQVVMTSGGGQPQKAAISSPAGSVKVSMKSGLSSPRSSTPASSLKVPMGMSTMGMSTMGMSTMGMSTMSTGSRARPPSPVGTLQAGLSMSATEAPTASLASLPARVDMASLEQRLPSSPLMPMPASQPAWQTSQPASQPAWQASQPAWQASQPASQPAWQASQPASQPAWQASQPATTAVGPSSSFAGSTLQANNTGNLAPETRTQYMGVPPIGLSSEEPLSLRPESAGQQPVPKVSDRWADFQAFKSNELETFRSARSRDQAEHSLVERELHDLETEKLGSLEQVYSELREEQLDNRLAYLEHVLETVEMRPGGTKGLTEADMAEGPLSWAARDFTEAHLPIPLYGFYVDKSRIHQREAQIDYQLSQEEMHPWIYMLAGKGNKETVATRWLQDQKAWRFNEAFTQAGDAPNYY